MYECFSKFWDAGNRLRARYGGKIKVILSLAQ